MSHEPLPALSGPLLHEASLAGKVFDSLEFARDGRHLSGRIAVADMVRLHDVAYVDTGLVSVDVVGELDAQRKHWLHLTIQGELTVTCQRCLLPLVQILEIESHLRVIRPGEPWPEDELAEDSDSEPDDAIEADEALDLLALVEEEIILVLPYAATHDVCELPVADEVDGKIRKASPFAALEVLKKC